MPKLKRKSTYHENQLAMSTQKELKHPDDPELLWLMKQHEFQQRLNNPPHYEMEDYLKPFILQEDFNFLREFAAIQAEYEDVIDNSSDFFEAPLPLLNAEIRKRAKEIAMLKTELLMEKSKEYMMEERAQQKRDSDKPRG